MKKLLTFAFAFAVATMAQASYLYWQTSGETSFNGHDVFGYNLIAIDGQGSSTAVTTGVMNFDEDTVYPQSDGKGFEGGMDYVVDISNYGSGYSFYVEMIGYDTAKYDNGIGVIGVSQTSTYDSLVQSGSIQVSGTALTIPQMWTGGAIAAPEPTSAMMILLGLAGLALKRKQV